MLVLILNSGSSSLKYQLMNMTDETSLAKGLCERIGIDGSMTYIAQGKKIIKRRNLPDHTCALNEVLHLLTKEDTGVIRDPSTIQAVGYRLASGLEKYCDSVKIDDDVISIVEKSAMLAPLHIPSMLNTITSCQNLFPDAVHVAVFDSSFHSTLHEENYIYPLPYEYYENYGFRKYSYHGLSGRFVIGEYFRLTGKPVKGSKLVVCHLGNGSTIMAIKDGKSIDASTGFSTAEGIMMGTRSGSIDPVVLLHAAKIENLSVDEMEHVLYHQSGLIGVSGLSNDYRDIKKAADEGNHRARLAINMLVIQIKKYIGSYAAEMNGLDGVIFTGGIGENAAAIRSQVCNGMEYIGLHLDEKLNMEDKRGSRKISAKGSACEAWVIPTNEELVIARDTRDLAKRSFEKLTFVNQ